MFRMLLLCLGCLLLIIYIIGIHESLISRSICLLWAKITSDAHISIRNPPSATDNRTPNPPSAGWVADADVCVAGDLGPEEAYASWDEGLMDANPSEVTVLDVFLLFSAKTAIPVFGDAAASAAAGRILETCQAPIHHAPGLRYIAEEPPCSDKSSKI